VACVQAGDSCGVKGLREKGVSRKSVSRKSVSRKSVSRKSVFRNWWSTGRVRDSDSFETLFPETIFSETQYPETLVLKMSLERVKYIPSSG
jgi:hypothetical protein